MATDSNTLLDEAKCLGCASNSSVSDMLKLGVLGRIASAYSAVQSFISRAGITDAAQIAALSSLAESAVSHGWWGKCDLIYPFVGGNAIAHAQNLKSSNFTITWNGAVTHNANGITGDGATGFGNTAYIPATSGQAALNSASISVYRRTLGSNGRQYLNARGTSVLHQLGISEGSPNTIVRLNDAGVACASTALGFVGGTRIAVNSRIVLVGGIKCVSTGASNTIPAVNMYVLASNQNGVTTLFSDANISSITVGSALTETEIELMAADWQTFQTALGRQV